MEEILKRLQVIEADIKIIKTSILQESGNNAGHFTKLNARLNEKIDELKNDIITKLDSKKK